MTLKSPLLQIASAAKIRAGGESHIFSEQALGNGFLLFSGDCLLFQTFRGRGNTSFSFWDCLHQKSSIRGSPCSRNPITQQRMNRAGLGMPTQNVDRKRVLRTFLILLPELTRGRGRGTSPSLAAGPALIFFPQAGSSGSSFDLCPSPKLTPEFRKETVGCFAFMSSLVHPQSGGTTSRHQRVCAHPVSRTHGSVHTQGMPGFTRCPQISPCTSIIL